MIIDLQKFQHPSEESPHTVALLYRLSGGIQGKSSSLQTFSRVLSILMAAMSLLVIMVFTIQSPVITPALLYTGIFFACCVLTCIAIFIVRNVLLCQVPLLAKNISEI
ncbi:hypothetical protein [Chlamydia vaughanii]|uniref:hypothetical protein n=1 Tax=Chlamydia vaughanii TaxID=3112552 RepID=UPI0032B11265